MHHLQKKKKFLFNQKNIYFILVTIIFTHNFFQISNLENPT